MFTVVVIIRRQRRRQTFVIDDVQLIRQHLFVLSKHLLCYLVHQLSSFVRTVQVRRHIRVCTALDAVPSRRTDVRVRLSAVSQLHVRIDSEDDPFGHMLSPGPLLDLYCLVGAVTHTKRFNRICSLSLLVSRYLTTVSTKVFISLSKLFNRIPRGVVRAL